MGPNLITLEAINKQFESNDLQIQYLQI